MTASINKILVAPGASMTSQEIADLVGKRHDNVKRAIETLVNQGVIVQPQIEDEQSRDAMGRSRVTQVYRFVGDQGKRDSIIVVAQLSPEFTASLVDRWQALEAAQQKPIAVPQSLHEALRLAADLAEKAEDAERARLALASEVQTMAPKVEALDRIAASTEAATSIRLAAKVAQVPERQYIQFLIEHKILYRDGKGRLMGYRDREHAGWIEHKWTRVQIDQEEVREIAQVLVTPLGHTKIAELIERFSPHLQKVSQRVREKMAAQHH